MNNIDVSVVIPVYNAEALINRCLDSVFGQSKSLKIEVIIVDDGSSDKSIELIKERPERDLIRIFQQSNSGPAKARNIGIIEARGKYIALLDADDYWLPDFLLITESFLESHSDCVAVSVAQRHLTTSGIHEAPDAWKSLGDKDGFVINDFYSFWAEHNHICTGSIMIRSSIAKLTEGQRVDMRICEDLEYWALIASYGKMAFIPRLLFVSDGAKVTENIGWVKKNLPRWNAAVSIDSWQKRIIERSPSLLMNEGFLKARGRIAKNLTYSILLSKRYQLAKEQIKLYGDTFPDDLVARLLKWSVRNPVGWFVISHMLVYREYHRK